MYLLDSKIPWRRIDGPSTKKDSSGAFVTQLDVGWIDANNGDTFGCEPSPGVDAEVKVHAIREGSISFNDEITNRTILQARC